MAITLFPQKFSSNFKELKHTHDQNNTKDRDLRKESMGFVPLRRSHHFHFSSSSSSLVPSLLHAPDMSAAFRPPEGTPPPIIGKAGNYTVFITPPLTPSPSESPRTPKTPIFTVDLTPKSKISSYSSPDLNSEKVAESAVPKTPPSPPTPPVQVPPHQFEKVNNVKLKKKNGGGEEEEEEGPFSFFWNAVAKVQDGIFPLLLLSLGKKELLF